MRNRKLWMSYVVSVKTDVPNKEVKSNLPSIFMTAGSGFAMFLEHNEIKPGEVVVLRQSPNNSSMHYYVLLFTDREPHEMRPHKNIDVFVS